MTEDVRHCRVCGTPFLRRGNQQMCGSQACETVAKKERRRRSAEARRQRRTPQERTMTDPVVIAEFEAYKKREAARKARVHKAMEERRARWGEVSGRDVVRYMLRGIA